MKFTSNVTIKWDGPKVKKLGEQTIEQSLLKMAIAIQSQAVLLVPVDQGRLKGSIFIKSKNFIKGNEDSNKALSEDIIENVTDPLTYHIGTNVRYAQYQEFGSIRNRAQPFLRPSMDLIASKQIEIIQSEGKSVFKDYLK